MLKYFKVSYIIRVNGQLDITNKASLIGILAIVAIGSASATVIATQTFNEDVIINEGIGPTLGEPGNLIINDGRLGIGATPGANQVIFASGKDGIPASFRVDGVNQAAVFSLRATGGQPVFQWVDDDLTPSTVFQARIEQPDTGVFQIIDATTLPAKVRMSIAPNGDVCIGAC